MKKFLSGLKFSFKFLPVYNKILHYVITIMHQNDNKMRNNSNVMLGKYTFLLGFCPCVIIIFLTSNK